MTNHTKDVLDARAAYIAFKKRKMRWAEINIQHHQECIHCQYMKTSPFGIKGIENLLKETQFRNEDESEPDHKFTSCIHVPDPKKPKVTALRTVLVECMPVPITPQ